MTTSLEDALREFSPAVRAEIQAEAERIYSEAMTLQALRKAREMTQVALSERLGKRQSTIAQIEKRSDLLISTIREYVEALGGTLSLQVQFPGHEPVTLKGLREEAEMEAGR